MDKEKMILNYEQHLRNGDKGYSFEEYSEMHKEVFGFRPLFGTISPDMGW